MQKISLRLNIWRCQIMIFKHGSHASESPDRPQTLGTAQKEVKFTRQTQIKMKQ